MEKDSTRPEKKKKPCLVYKIAQSSGIFIKTTDTVQIGNEIRFPVAAFGSFYVCIKLQKAIIYNLFL